MRKEPLGWLAIIALGFAVLAAVALATLPGCAWWQAKGKPAAQCVAADLEQQWPGLVAQVAAALAGANWEGALLTIAEKVGMDAVTCAVQAAAATPQAPPAALHSIRWLKAAGKVGK